MNYELQIAKRILFGNQQNGIAKPIVRIALFSVALGLAIMLVSIMVVTGFKNEITDKVAGFGSHIQVGNFSSNESYESEPIEKDSLSAMHLDKNQYVNHTQVFATKSGIIKTKTEIQGIVLKGIGTDFNWTFFKNKIINGSAFQLNDSIKSDEVILSKKIADLLKLKVGDKVHVYFIQQPPRIRVFKISGIYHTGLEEFDETFMLCDIRQIQKLNDWTENQVGGCEVELKDLSQIDDAVISVNSSIGIQYSARSIKDIYPQIFNWLDLVDTNVVVIIVLMLIVSIINMISTLLIIILDNISVIGILKAIGATDVSIRKIFFFVSFYLIAAGILFGNLLGLGLGFLQWKFHLIKIPQDTYYIAYAPIDISFSAIMLLNITTLFVCLMFLVLPALIVARIRPVNAIRFE